MTVIINSFDKVVAEVMGNRPHSDFTWYGKVEIESSYEVNVHVLLCSPSLSRPPQEVWEFKRDPRSNDLVLSNDLGRASVEEKSDRLEIYVGTIPNCFSRFSKLDQRLGETFLVPKYRKQLLAGLSAQEPEAIRWATVHGLPVWREKKRADSSGSYWQQATLPYVPFEYEPV